MNANFIDNVNKNWRKSRITNNIFSWLSLESCERLLMMYNLALGHVSREICVCEEFHQYMQTHTTIHSKICKNLFKKRISTIVEIFTELHSLQTHKQFDKPLIHIEWVCIGAQTQP